MFFIVTLAAAAFFYLACTRGKYISTEAVGDILSDSELVFDGSAATMRVPMLDSRSPAASSSNEAHFEEEQKAVVVEEEAEDKSGGGREGILENDGMKDDDEDEEEEEEE